MREGQEIEIEPEHARYIWVRGGLSKPVGMNIPVDPPRFSSRAGGGDIHTNSIAKVPHFSRKYPPVLKGPLLGEPLGTSHPAPRRSRSLRRRCLSRLFQPLLQLRAVRVVREALEVCRLGAAPLP